MNAGETEGVAAPEVRVRFQSRGRSEPLFDDQDVARTEEQPLVGIAVVLQRGSCRPRWKTALAVPPRPQVDDVVTRVEAELPVVAMFVAVARRHVLQRIEHRAAARL